MPRKMIGGVAAGLADYLDIDATIVRLLFVLAAFFGGSGLLVYIVLWIAMPAGTYSGTAGTNPGAAGTASPPLQNPVRQPGEPSGNKSATVIGWILVGLGVFFLMDELMEPWFRNFFYWFNFDRLWPVVFVIVGVLIISSASKKAAREGGTGPEDSGTGSPDPGTGPEDPGTGPRHPGTGPQHPGTGPENPGTGPEGPETRPHNPESSPGAAPRIPGSSIPPAPKIPSTPRSSPGYTGPSGTTAPLTGPAPDADEGPSNDPENTKS